MSYLATPRIHFFGKYFANPSTINYHRTLIQTWIKNGSPRGQNNA